MWLLVMSGVIVAHLMWNKVLVICQKRRDWGTWMDLGSWRRLGSEKDDDDDDR